MAKFEIKFKATVTRDLQPIPKRAIKQILDSIDLIALNPRGTGCQKLSGYELYRVRVGRYRIVYEIRDDKLIVLVIQTDSPHPHQLRTF